MQRRLVTGATEMTIDQKQTTKKTLDPALLPHSRKELKTALERIKRTAARMDHPASVLIVWCQDIATEALRDV